MVDRSQPQVGSAEDRRIYVLRAADSRQGIRVRSHPRVERARELLIDVGIVTAIPQGAKHGDKLRA